jgi:hypothetical protein
MFLMARTTTLWPILWVSALGRHEWASSLLAYEGFECMMWLDDDADLKKWQVTRRQFHRCLRLAFAELKRS